MIDTASADTASAVPLTVSWGPSTIRPPAGLTALWGARAITTGDAGFDLLGDRQETAGPDAARLVTCLNTALPDVRRAAAAAFRDGTLAGNSSNVVTLYAADGLVVVGTCQRSYGYLYLFAWLGEPPVGGVYGPIVALPLPDGKGPSDAVRRLLTEASWAGERGLPYEPGLVSSAAAGPAIKKGWLTVVESEATPSGYNRLILTALGRRALATPKAPAPARKRSTGQRNGRPAGGWSLWR